MACIYTKLIGRFGNQLFQYAYTKAHCEQNGDTLVTDKWVGQGLFNISDPLPPGKCKSLDGYFQDQGSMIYTRSQARSWFTIRPEIKGFLDQHLSEAPILCHRRVGDYAGLSYVVVSLRSYWDALVKFGYKITDAAFITEENPGCVNRFPQELMFFVDFYCMMKTPVLFRGNSSFSWWAATLAPNTQKIYSPVITGMVSGERDCEFVPGNSSRFCELPFVTDLHIKE